MPQPHRMDIFSPQYLTYRRLWLDQMLSFFAPEMCGTVLDLGGKRTHKRGTFQPPEAQASAWWYLNLEPVTVPDLFADVTAVPFPDEAAEVIICTEVLEHLRQPEACTREIWRVLKPGGVAFVSVPFLYPIHADPYDFQRFTADGLRQLLGQFSSLEILPMGGFWGVLGMFLESGLPGLAGPSLQRKLLRRSLTWVARRLCALDLARWPEQNSTWQKFTTGYFIKATK